MPNPDREHEGFEGLPSLVNSLDWREFVFLLKQRQVELQEQVNIFVRAQNMLDAYATLARKKDVDRMLEIVNRRVKEIEANYKPKKGGK